MSSQNMSRYRQGWMSEAVWRARAMTAELHRKLRNELGGGAITIPEIKNRISIGFLEMNLPDLSRFGSPHMAPNVKRRSLARRSGLLYSSWDWRDCPREGNLPQFVDRSELAMTLPFVAIPY